MVVVYGGSADFADVASFYLVLQHSTQMGSTKTMKFLRKPVGIRAFVAVLVIALTVYAFVSSQRATVWAGLSTAGPLPISLEQAPKLFQQCSRQAPKPDGAVWLPKDSAVRDLEQKLGHFFSRNLHLHELLIEKQSLATSLGMNPDVVKYRGQFVGFERDGKRLIYASYLTRNLALSGQRGDNAIIFCDGGSAAWGIVYDLQRNELGEFDVNRGR